jgi:tRNA nucleotidyltransferase (CCA-adding enzyme)
VTFGCKFSAVRDAPLPFVNKTPEPIIELLELTGFDVTSTKVKLDSHLYNYVEIKGVKRPT